MNYQSLKNISYKKDISRAELARLSHVSRAAVTKWFHQGQKTGWINVETKTLMQLSKSLQIEPQLLLQERANLEEFATCYLWDTLYPNMEAFIHAVAIKSPQAIARLVQVHGFWRSAKIAGKKSVQNFHDYKKYIKPVRKKELEVLWPLYQSKI